MGVVALHIAAEAGYDVVVKQLLEAGAKINEQDKVQSFYRLVKCIIIECL